METKLEILIKNRSSSKILTARQEADVLSAMDEYANLKDNNPDYYVLESINGIPYIFKEKHLAEHLLNNNPSWANEKANGFKVIEVYKKNNNN